MLDKNVFTIELFSLHHKNISYIRTYMREEMDAVVFLSLCPPSSKQLVFQKKSKLKLMPVQHIVLKARHPSPV